MPRFIWSLAIVLLAAPAFAASPGSYDWPQWNGLDRNGASKEQGLLKEWPKAGPPLAWKTKGIGGGYSAPSIAAGVVYGMSNRGADEIVWALSEKDGKELWTSRLGPAVHQGNPQGAEGPACTPIVDGDMLYVEGMAGDVSCVRISDHKVVWQRSMTREFGGKPPMWSFRESPLVDGNKVICTPGGRDATLAALDKLTGKTLWTAKVPGSPGASYASAIAIDFEGQREYVQFTAKTLLGVAADDGKFLWRYDRPANSASINCTTPFYQDGTVFATSAYNTGGGLAKLSKDGSGVKATEVYFSSKMQNQHGGVVVSNGYLYGASGGNEGGYLACLDFKTGKVQWDEHDVGKRRAPKGAAALADGHLYYLTEKGVVLLIEANPKEYVERGRFNHPDRTSSTDWTHPVIANGKLYLRDQDTLLCYDIKAK